MSVSDQQQEAPMQQESRPDWLILESEAAAAAVNDAYEQYPHPGSETIRSLEAGELVLIALTAGTGEAINILRRTHGLAEHASKSALDGYLAMSGRGPNRITVPGNAPDAQTLIPTREFVGSVAATNAIDYAILTEQGIGTVAPLNPRAVSVAEHLLLRSPDDPTMARFVRLAWERALLGEEAETVRAAVAQTTSAAERVIAKGKAAIQQIEAHPLTEHPAVGRLVRSAGSVVGHAATFAAMTVPFGTAARGHAQKLIATLDSREREVLGFMMQRTDAVIGSQIGVQGYKHQDVDLEAWLMGTRMAQPDLIPDDVDLGDVAQALATRAAVLLTDRMFGPHASGEYAAAGHIAAVAAAYDYDQGVKGSNESVTYQSDMRQRAALAQVAIDGAQQ